MWCLRLGLLQKRTNLALSLAYQMFVFGFQVKHIMTGIMTTMRPCFCIRTRDESRGTTLRCNRNRPNMRDMCQGYGMAYNTGRLLPFCSPCLLELQPTYINSYTYKTLNPKINNKQKLHPKFTCIL